MNNKGLARAAGNPKSGGPDGRIKKRKRIGPALVILLIFCAVMLAGCLFVGGLYIYIDRAADSDIYAAGDVPHAQAALVLGAQVFADGRPSKALRYRLDAAIGLYETGKVEKILASGDHGTKEYDEVAGMMNYLLAAGIPREDIFLDHAGFDTYNSVYRARDVFCAESVIIVTQDFHLRRALYLADRLGLPAVGVAAQDLSSPYTMAKLYIREAGARVKALWEVVSHTEPVFLGEKLPLTGDGTVTAG